MIDLSPANIERAFWIKWQRINGIRIAPSYGRAWTEAQMLIYVLTPQVPCRQWFEKEHRHHMAEHGKFQFPQRLGEGK